MSPEMVSVGEEGEGHSMLMERRQKRRGNQQWRVWCEESKTRVTWVQYTESNLMVQMIWGGIESNFMVQMTWGGIESNLTVQMTWGGIERNKLNGPNDLGWNRQNQRFK